MRRDVTMLDLVTAVTEHTRTEGEAIATIVHMVNSGAVRLCGTFSGARIDLGEIDRSNGRTAVTAAGENPSKPRMPV
jgi:hypothetical protein